MAWDGSRQSSLGALPALCFPPPLQRQLTTTSILIMFLALVLFSFCSLVFMTVLFYFLWPGPPYIPLFLLSAGGCSFSVLACSFILHVLPSVCSLSFAISFDCLFLLIFFHSSLFFPISSLSLFFPLALLSLYSLFAFPLFSDVHCTSLFCYLDSPFSIFFLQVCICSWN